MARKHNDDTTEKLFPPEENPNPDAPIPIGPSLRLVWKDHQRDIDERFARFERLLETRRSVPPDISPKSAARRILRGAGLGGKAVIYVSGGLGLAALAARALGRADVAGPIEQIQQLFGP